MHQYNIFCGGNTHACSDSETYSVQIGRHENKNEDDSDDMMMVDEQGTKSDHDKKKER